MEVVKKEMERLNYSISPLRQQLSLHPLYNQLKSQESLVTFLGSFIYSIWSQNLLFKSLQSCLNDNGMPITTDPFKVSKRLSSLALLKIESGLESSEGRLGYLESYLNAYESIGGNVLQVNNFIRSIYDGGEFSSVVKILDVPQESVEYMKFNWSVAATNQPHIIAAQLFFASEWAIPELFLELLKSDALTVHSTKLKEIKDLFTKQMEPSSFEDGVLVQQMFQELCGYDKERWKEVERIATESLQSRIQLWDGISERVKQQNGLMEAVF